MGDIMQIKDRIGRHMKLQDLHVLMTVTQAGSMGKAAERLNSSQPSVSRSITELERSLGVILFDRHRQGIEPTEYAARCSIAEPPYSMSCVRVSKTSNFFPIPQRVKCVSVAIPFWR